MKNLKAFTLIELLVVVAIIGILAAVAVVSFGGFTESAKISSTKYNYNLTVKFIRTELIRCDTGSTKAFNNSVSCSSLNPSAIIPAVQAILNDQGGFKTSYTLNNTLVRNTGSSSSDLNIGAIFLNGGSFDSSFNPGFSPSLTGNSFRVTTCFKIPCSDQNNQLQTVIILP
jgi:type IV pilus assembly protein PilA